MIQKLTTKTTHENMQKHAYLIIAHADMYSLKTLLKLLDYESNYIFLNIDPKFNTFSTDEIETKNLTIGAILHNNVA